MTAPARLIDGRAHAARLRTALAQRSTQFVARTGIAPGLVVVIVGENPASQVYVRSKHQACLDLGWHSEICALPATATQAQVAETLDALNADHRVHGILLQLPLPAHLDEQALLQAIRPEKDVDGFHPVNVGKLSLGLEAPVPCTPAGIIRLLIDEGIETAGRHAVVIGRSNIVGKPVAQLLLRKGPGGDCTVTIAHSRTPSLAEVVRQADIVVAALGAPRFVQAAWLKPGAVVIDVGINRIADPAAKSGSRLVGDVDFEPACAIASAITPVPGGVGPMTIAMLLENTLQAAERATALLEQ